MNDDMISIQIQAGCLSGNSEHDEIGFWNQSSVVHVHKSLVHDFIEWLMVSASQQADAAHWEVKE
jgi:hypothetical protein